MQPETFVNVVRQVVQQAAAEDMISYLQNPPGRRPAMERVEQGAWFARLADQDRAKVEAIVAETARIATFGMLCALDGSRAVLNRAEGRIELIFRSSSEATLLTASDGSGTALHELL